ncbi:immunity 22 family protein [Humisphaera borealis]|uniref:Immunity 22 family protein n=1 Tax=Humisphaera borealis TaxID=2807512 RepID=A0A7M2WTK2_9BACT|nr:immunity 22 family protein [Humisphaera borealis]QOV88594.1 immunity 22 family protein [Humisphaera borealis]
MKNRKKITRDGPPHFGEEGRVSIWVGIAPLKKVPKDYFDENHEDEDAPIDQFAADFGFGYYSHDLVELNDEEPKPRPTHELLAFHSYSMSFIDEAAAAAAKAGVKTSQFAVVMFDFDYNPKVTGVSRNAYLQFIGSFDYDKDAPVAAEDIDVTE